MIEINGEHWDIVLVPPFDPMLHMRDNFYAIGVCDDKLKTIAIN
jgi:acetylornithine deacetylase/succinyl-diaminopimelate desuccinylase-like protein